AVPLRLVRRDLHCKALMMSMLAVKIDLIVSTKTLNPLPVKCSALSKKLIYLKENYRIDLLRRCMFMSDSGRLIKLLVVEFCDFPDEVLIQILALLPLKDAVRTSVSSKRWEHLWALVPDLYFRDSDLSKSPPCGRILCSSRGISYENFFSLIGPSLKSFHDHGVLVKEYCILGVTRQLVEAKLLLSFRSVRDREVAQGNKLLSVFSNVKELTLSYAILEGFKYYPENGIEELLYQMPSCFLTELTKISVKFRNGIGGPEELFMVGIFLKKVVASREMVILFPEDCVGEENLLESLSKFPKGSKKCRISLQSQPMGRDWKILWD
ncbi:hypothetical protein CRG98_025460, partial [Punica granatum]